MVFALFGCSGQEAPVVKESSGNNRPVQSDPDRETKTQDKTKSQTAYYFTDGLLLGSYDESGWHSLCDTSGKFEPGAGNAADFYAKDLLTVPEYHVYSRQSLVGDAKSIIWLTEEEFGLGSFEVEGITGKFSKYGEMYSSDGRSLNGHRIFSLPTILGDEFTEIKIPKYSFWTYFPIGENWSYEQNEGILVTNGDSINFISGLEENISATTEAESALRKLFADADMGNTVSNFIQGFKGDFDGDGADEYVFAANHPNPESNGYWPVIEGEGTKDDVGTFSALIYQDDDGKVQILHSDIRRLGKGPVTFSSGYYDIRDIEFCHTLKLTDIADLNGDGRYEFIIDIGLWEGGYDEVFSLNQEGTYEVVLRSNSGM